MHRLYATPGKTKLIYDDRNQIRGFTGQGEGVARQGHTGPFGDVGNILYLACGGCLVVAWFDVFVKTHQTAHLKWVHFLIFKLHPKKLIFKNQNKKI